MIFFMFVVAVNFLMINFLLALIMEASYEAHEVAASDDHEVVDFIMERFVRLVYGTGDGNAADAGLQYIEGTFGSQAERCPFLGPFTENLPYLGSIYLSVVVAHTSNRTEMPAKIVLPSVSQLTLLPSYGSPIFEHVLTTCFMVSGPENETDELCIDLDNKFTLMTRGIDDLIFVSVNQKEYRHELYMLETGNTKTTKKRRTEKRRNARIVISD